MRRFAVGSMMVVLVLIVLDWAQSYNGRRDVVASSRANCERGSRNLVAIVNWDRIQQGANEATAMTPGVPSALRVERRGIVAEQEHAIRTLDGHIDRGVWWLLSDRRDRRLVRSGAFRCDRAFPSASPFQFVN